ncbi:hypothetical protein OAR97_00630 [Arcobacteraceae bacterium]|nr:hypothetical protein [Arcobacteraceae bacterium]
MNSHLKNIVVSGVSTIPFCDGVSVLIDKYIPDNLQKKRDKLIDTFLNDLETIENIDEDFLKSEDFTMFFLRIFNKVMVENNQIKSKIFESILKNIASQNYKIDLETEMFIKLTEDLITHQFYFLYSIKSRESTYTNAIYSLTGLKNYGLIETEDSQLHKVKYKLTTLGERFYLYVNYENVYKEVLDELNLSKNNDTKV